MNELTQGSRFGIKGRLIIGFLLIVITFVIFSIISLKFINKTNTDSNIYLNTTLPTEKTLQDLRSAIVETQVILQKIVFFKDNNAKNDLNGLIANINKLADATEQNMSKINDKTLTTKWDNLDKKIQDYLDRIAKLKDIIASEPSEKTLDFYQQNLLPYINELNNNFNMTSLTPVDEGGFLDDLNNVMKNDIMDINNQINSLFISLITFIFLALIISYIISVVTARSILKPVKYANDIARKIASGQRDIDIHIEKNDEIGELLHSMKIMLNAIVSGEKKIEQNTSDILQACSSLVSTLDEVRHSVDVQSSGASEQASSINQITASITEIEKSATQTMTKAKDLGNVAEKTRQRGQLGLDSIETSVLGMKAVKERVQLIAQTILALSSQTQQVGEITAAVNNLAQQSKMLALNASIEAAKAGEAGKGFAVVASEVKNLAEQSESATSQVQKILEDIRIATEKAVMVTEEGTKGVDNGLQMIERTGEVIRNLNDVIRETSIASQQIEAAVRQETSGIEQITAGMNEINIVTSSFVESVNQTTEAMDDLSNVTHKLKSSVETL